MTDAKRRADRKYHEKSYDRINMYCKKGDKDKYKLIAENLGLSLNAFIISAIEEKIEKMIENSIDSE